MMKNIFLILILSLLSCNKQEGKPSIGNNKEMKSLKNVPNNIIDEGDDTRSEYDEHFLEENKRTPDKVTNHLIFTKKDGKLEINTKILDYIQKNTNNNDNSYSIALSKYVTKLIINHYDNDKPEWTEEELFKIIAYASNTTDPLFKKYWKDDFKKWNNGRDGYILGFCNTAYHDQIWSELTNNFKKNNYYNLPYLEDMVWYGSDFDKTGAP